VKRFEATVVGLHLRRTGAPAVGLMPFVLCAAEERSPTTARASSDHPGSEGSYELPGDSLRGFSKDIG
jgi:hypothetical protein